MGGFKEKALGRRGTALENLRKRKVGLPIVSRNIVLTYIYQNVACTCNVHLLYSTILWVRIVGKTDKKLRTSSFLTYHGPIRSSSLSLVSTSDRPKGTNTSQITVVTLQKA